jgi:hypothetical protein
MSVSLGGIRLIPDACGGPDQERGLPGSPQEHVLTWWAFQAGHQDLCQPWIRAKTDFGCAAAIFRIGQSAQLCSFSRKSALCGIDAALLEILHVFSI